jgi:hypothetical protein
LAPAPAIVAHTVADGCRSAGQKALKMMVEQVLKVVIAFRNALMKTFYFTGGEQDDLLVAAWGRATGSARYAFLGTRPIEEEARMQKGAADPAIKQKVLDYLDTVEKAKSKEIAKAISEEKSAVDLAVKELAFEDKVEYLYITTTFVALKGKVAPPE